MTRLPLTSTFFFVTTSFLYSLFLRQRRANPLTIKISLIGGTSAQYASTVSRLILSNLIFTTISSGLFRCGNESLEFRWNPNLSKIGKNHFRWWRLTSGCQRYHNLTVNLHFAGRRSTKIEDFIFRCI